MRKFEAPAGEIYKALERARVWSALGTHNAKRREKALRRRTYNLIRDFVNKTANEIVELALSNQAEVWIDAPFDKSVRELYRKMPKAEKILLAGMRKLARRVEELGRWHGVLVRRVVLYSTRCPVCNAELEGRDRVMYCRCGFSAERDYVPLYWARRLWAERQAQSPSFFLAHLNCEAIVRLTQEFFVVFTPAMRENFRWKSPAFSGPAPAS